MVEKLSVLKNTSEISNDWVPIKKWMTIFKIFIVLGIVIFTIGQFAMVSDTDLAAYIWFSIGLIATWVITLRIIANKKGESLGILSTFNNLSQFLPTLGVMVPLAILIYVLIKTRPILQSNMEKLT